MGNQTNCYFEREMCFCLVGSYQWQSKATGPSGFWWNHCKPFPDQTPADFSNGGISRIPLVSSLLLPSRKISKLGPFKILGIIFISWAKSSVFWTFLVHREQLFRSDLKYPEEGSVGFHWFVNYGLNRIQRFRLANEWNHHIILNLYT